MVPMPTISAIVSSGKDEGNAQLRRGKAGFRQFAQEPDVVQPDGLQVQPLLMRGVSEAHNASISGAR
jgi:hypothetical protein